MHIRSFNTSRRQRSAIAFRVLSGLAAPLLLATSLSSYAATLDRIKETGHIKIGYFVDTPPFASRSEAGAPEGYAVSLCQRIADGAKSQLSLTELAVDWVPVTLDDRLGQLKEGSIDLLCSPISPTAARRQEVSFSVPIFPGGVRAVMQADAAVALRNAFAETPEVRPVWRGTPAAKLLDKKTFAVVKGTTTESWLADRIKTFQIDSRIEPVADYRAALQQLTDRKVDVFFGERSLVLSAMNASQREKLAISDRMLTYEPFALAMARGDEDFRLLVDRTLSAMYSSPQFEELYKKWCGAFDGNTRAFFLWNTLAQ